MKLTVATLNTGLFQILKKDIVPHVDERFPFLPGVLESLDADVVCLQEMFMAHHAQDLMRALAHRYPYSARAHSRAPYYSPGLLTLSRFPITQQYFQRFRTNLDIEHLASHGFLSSTLRTEKGLLTFYNTHLSAGGFRHFNGTDESTHLAQKDQLAELTYAASQKRAILIGDFNTGPKEKNPATYASFLESEWTDAVTALNRHIGPTLARSNSLRKKYNEYALADRVDHLFFKKGSGIIPKSAKLFAEDLLPGKNFHLSDHFGLLVTLDIRS